MAQWLNNPPAMQEPQAMQFQLLPGGVCGNLLQYPLVFSGKSHGQRSMTGYSPKGHRESDMSEDTNIGQLANIVR